MFKLPFGMMPGSWGLRGKTREIARAEYELTGYDKDKRIVEIQNDDPKDRFKAIKKIDLKHKRISDYEYHKAVAEHDLSGASLAKALRELDFNHGKITQQEYHIAEANANLVGKPLEARLLEIEYEHSDMSENDFNKQLANIKDEPYIAVISSEYDPTQSINGFVFEFDWNNKWIELLINHGYTGLTEDQVVQRWFEDLCRGVVSESMGDQPLPFNSSRVVNRVPRDDGKADYT